MTETKPTDGKAHHKEGLSQMSSAQLQIPFKDWKDVGGNGSDTGADSVNSISKDQRLVLLSDITLDEDVQMREELSKSVISDYAEQMNGDDFPPVTIFFDGQNRFLADGFHRYFAAKEIGKQSVMASIISGAKRDAILHAAGANAQHGLRRTNRDKRKAALRLLMDDQWQQWSDSEIAQACNVSHAFIGKLRKALLKGGNASTVRKTKDGRKIDTKNIGPKKTPPDEIKLPTLRDFMDSRDASPAVEKTESSVDPLAAILGDSLDATPDPLTMLKAENAQLKAENTMLKAELEHWKQEAEKQRMLHADMIQELPSTQKGPG